MRYKQSIGRVASILLMILLTQKMVGGLYLHNWLHGAKNVYFRSQEQKAVTQYNCSCIDDFYTPYTESAPVSVDAPPALQPVFFAVPEISLSVVARVFQSLRGPPVS